MKWDGVEWDVIGWGGMGGEEWVRQSKMGWDGVGLEPCWRF